MKKALPLFLIFLVAVASPAYAFSFSFDLSSLFDSLESPFVKLNELIYGSDVVKDLELYKTNYEETNGIYVEKISWQLISTSSVEGIEASSYDLQKLRELAESKDVGVIILFKRLPDISEIYRIAEALGGEVFHIDYGINAVCLKLVDKPKLKAFIEQNASELNVAAVYLDLHTRVPEKPDPEKKPSQREMPERPVDNRTNNTIDKPDYRPWVGNPHDIKEEAPSAKNETVREVEIQKEQVEKVNWNDNLIHANDLWEENITGRKVVIAVLDTGVDEDHPMVNGSVIGSISMVEGEDAHDYHGHGSHCAGIAAGRPVLAKINGKEVWISGVAPNAQILNVKVLGKDGSGSLSSVIKGLDYVAEWKDKHPDTPVVVSMSLGTPFGNPSDPVAQKVKWLVKEKKIPVVVAAGNEFVVIDSPGCAEGAITVAAVDKDGKVASFSGKGPGTNVKDVKPDIAAPGVKIPSARANSNQLVEMSGTSMATPHVAGVIALVLEEDPEFQDKPDRIKEVLQSTAVDRPGVLEIEEGAGIVDAYAAVKKLPKSRYGILAEIKAKIFGGG